MDIRCPRFAAVLWPLNLGASVREIPIETQPRSYFFATVFCANTLCGFNFSADCSA